MLRGGRAARWGCRYRNRNRKGAIDNGPIQSARRPISARNRCADIRADARYDRLRPTEKASRAAVLWVGVARGGAPSGRFLGRWGVRARGIRRFRKKRQRAIRRRRATMRPDIKEFCASRATAPVRADDSPTRRNAGPDGPYRPPNVSRVAVGIRIRGRTRLVERKLARPNGHGGRAIHLGRALLIVRLYSGVPNSDRARPAAEKKRYRGSAWIGGRWHTNQPARRFDASLAI